MTSKEYFQSLFPRLPGEIVLILFLVGAFVILGLILLIVYRVIFSGSNEDGGQENVDPKDDGEWEIDFGGVLKMRDGKPNTNSSENEGVPESKG